MGKQTKILLGLGAVIAAYLILKPKKATGQTAMVVIPKEKIDLTDVDPTSSYEVLKELEKWIPSPYYKSINTTDQIICSEGSRYSSDGYCRDSEGNLQPQIENPNYNEDDKRKLDLEMQERFKNQPQLKGDPIGMMICGDGNLGYNCY